MSIEEILKANSRFLAKYRRLKPPKANGWAIVTCCDRRLSGLLEAAMGFRPGEAHVVRNAGNIITPFDNSVIRSLSLFVLKGGVENIAVIGHTDCAACTGTAELSRAMESAGLRREMAGSDLREFYGLAGDPAANVRAAVDRIATSGLLPAGINIFGLLIETRTGKLLPVCEHTIAPLDIPYLFDSGAYRTQADIGSEGITQQKSVRGQEKVRQFAGLIEVPKKVHSPVESVKVPINIRTPVREVKVPTRVTVHKKAVEVPVRIRMPESQVDLREVGRELKGFLARESGKRGGRDLDLLRGQAQGSWDTAKTPARPGTAKEKEYKFCPRCGTEYFPHVEKCPECHIRLVTGRKIERKKARKIRPVLSDQRRVAPRPKDRRRGYDRHGRRR